ncbi:MAG: hypothetical protein CMJ19_22905 [Phycisphaeraceae bacterium]|nr:hypothetical protein [Phycisphaeraceae bacterium]
MKKQFKPTSVLAVLLIVSLLCNAAMAILWMQERSYAINKVRESAGSIGFLRARLDYQDGHRRLFQIQDRPEFSKPGAHELNTGVVKNGLEIWAVGSYSDKPYLCDFGDGFLNAYNQTMRRLVVEKSDH